ncbi:hypothetical protein SteCoe_28486 [Stentor coeruleus]|uniref:Uncharacterized protein n=1 Tax=Stentor coeruleus TaxID=5963 RepID=A0A1R2B8N5_9CILI|nr:hypothetical protein SteCoe_28486 [Stentor coeruleus]
MENFLLFIGILIAIKFLLFCKRRLKKFNLSGKHIMITGASSGLGKELARECYYKGARLTLISRNKLALDSLLKELEPSSRKSDYGNFVQIYNTDLSKNDKFEEIVKSAESRFGGVELFVSCAGHIEVGSFLTSKQEDFREQMENNYMSLVNSLLPVAKEMCQRKKGRICIVSAAQVYMPVEGNSAWLASKAAVHAFANCIRPELNRNKVHLSIFAPGAIDTEGWEKVASKKQKYLLDIEGKPLSVEKACTELLRGISACDLYITTNPIFRFIRICSLGAAERGNSIIDILLSPFAMLTCCGVAKYINFKSR